jgi:hypothetical protein
MSNLSEEQLHESRLAEYKEVSQNFRTLTEIRFKLLGLLPVGTALIALSTAWSKGEISVPLSLFGLAVTLALIVYNERNNQLYDALVARAGQLENLLGLPDGNFSQRPGTWLKIRPIPETQDCKFAVTIEHGWPIGTIYRASIIAWLFMFFSPIFGWLGAKFSSLEAFDSSWAGALSVLFAIITAFSLGQLFLNWFEAQKSERRKSMRKAAAEAVHKLAALKFSKPESADLDEWHAIFSDAAQLRGGEFEEELHTVLRRALFYLSEDLRQSTNNTYYPMPPYKSSRVFGATTAAYVIGLLTDLPARWLIDVYSGRRGPKEQSKGEGARSTSSSCGTQANKVKIREWIESITS